MKKKIVGIFVCMLMFTTTIPVVGIRNNEMNNHLSISVENTQGENLPLLSINIDYEIIRDDYGVPHVYSETREGLSYGMGYAIAEDRLWQLDVFRRQGTGRLAEFGLGPIKDDRLIRTIGYSKESIISLYNNISSPYKEMIAAYIAGVNSYIEEAIADPNNKMPAEYIERGLLPEYFTVEDILLTAIVIAKLFQGGTGNELIYLSNLFALNLKNGKRNGWKIFNDLYPINDPGAATTFDDNRNEYSQIIHENPPVYSLMVLKLAQQIIKNIKSIDHTFDLLGAQEHLGSNAWVVSPEKSASGNTLFLAGPQDGYSIPSIDYEIGLHGANIDLIGITYPGLGPFTLETVGKWCAWTSTSGFSDIVDTYIERLHPLNKEKYKFNGAWHNMEKQTEIIYDAKGKAHTYELYRTIHGPVLGKFWIPILGGFAITQTEPSLSVLFNSYLTCCKLPECKNVSEFITTLKDYYYSNNFSVTDRYGNIGYFHSGQYPIRPEKGLLGRTIDRRLPLWGTGKEEWQGFLPFEEHPQGINPSEGFYANWNNKPCPDWPFSEGDRIWHQCGWGENVRRIQELLEADDSITFEDMIDICKNVAYHEVVGTLFKPFLMEAINNTGGIPVDVVIALENWDCYYNDFDSDGYYDDPGITIFIVWGLEMISQVLRDEIPNSIPWYDAINILLHVLQGDESPLELMYKDYLNGIPRDEMIIDVLEEVLIALETQFGTSNVSEWLSPIAPLTENNPIFAEIGNLKSPEKIGYNLPYMNRGTYNQIAELPNWEWSNESNPPIGRSVLPCGQSGFVKYPDIISPHAYDQLDLYLNWEFKPMLFNISSPK